jgi:hypothetical protein
MLIPLLALVTLASSHADSCGQKRMDCYFDTYSMCTGPLKSDPTCQTMMKKVLKDCDRIYHCEGAAAAAEKPLNPGYKIHARVQYDESCAPYRPMLDQTIDNAVSRFQDCLNYAFVKEDIAKRMVAVLESNYAVRLYCNEPPRSNWCAAGGLGQVILSPSRVLAKGSFCHADLGGLFIHEMAHVANLKPSAEHNEMGETGELDEVYSLQNYCMRPARNWLMRARRTVDVVDAERLSCVRDYQEYTPSTLRDPFWGEYRGRMDRGVDPCPPSLDPSLAEKRTPRRGD